MQSEYFIIVVVFLVSFLALLRETELSVLFFENKESRAKNISLTTPSSFFLLSGMALKERETNCGQLAQTMPDN